MKRSLVFLAALIVGCSPQREPPLTDAERGAIEDTILALWDQTLSGIEEVDAAKAYSRVVVLDGEVRCDRYSGSDASPLEIVLDRGVATGRGGMENREHAYLFSAQIVVSAPTRGRVSPNSGLPAAPVRLAPLGSSTCGQAADT